MIHPTPLTLEGHGLRLEPLDLSHAEALANAATDGRLWELGFTTVPEPESITAYIEAALAGLQAGSMLPWAVRELSSWEIVGTTRYHDIIPTADRVEIGYTWYAKRWQRTHVNTVCKLLLLRHAFDSLGCGVVGWRTDILNLNSQTAIAALGARKDGVIRHNMARRDGTIRDTVMYSVTLGEWPTVEAGLLARLERQGYRSDH